jgi:hypothetical protein
LPDSAEDQITTSNEVCCAAVLIAEILNSRGKPKSAITFNTKLSGSAITDFEVDRNGDRKEDAHYAMWFDRQSGAVRKIDADLNGDGKKDWQIKLEYQGNKLPTAILFDTDLDGDNDISLPLSGSLGNRLHQVDLDSCKNLFGISGKLDISRTLGGSLNCFGLDLKTPKRSFKVVEVRQNIYVNQPSRIFYRP